MTYYSYGMAILANADHLNLTDAEMRTSFRREFTALTAYYGVSPIPLKFRKKKKDERQKNAFVDTFSFQAPAFYKKYGYREVFTLEEYPYTGKRHYYTKELL